MLRFKNFRVIIFIVLGMFLILVFGCGQKSSSQQSKKQAETKLLLGTAGSGGTFYVIGGGMADIVSKYSNIKVTTSATQGQFENARLLHNKKIDIGLLTTDVAAFAFSGENWFKQDGAMKDLRQISGGHTSIAQIVATKNSGITNLAGLKGKKVAVGAPGSAVNWTSEVVLAAADLTLKDVAASPLSQQEAANAMKDGTIEAAILIGGVPQSSVMDLVNSREINFISLGSSDYQKFVKRFPKLENSYFLTKLPPNTYAKQAKEIETIAIPTVVATTDAISEEAVYTFIKTLSDHLDEFGKVHLSAKEYDLEHLKKGWVIPLHPGAEKFYKEKGVLKK